MGSVFPNLFTYKNPFHVVNFLYVIVFIVNGDIVKLPLFVRRGREELPQMWEFEYLFCPKRGGERYIHKRGLVR